MVLVNNADAIDYNPYIYPNLNYYKDEVVSISLFVCLSMV